ncbi:hypothetical protein [Prosthecobacter sp.]|uniref:hypothetical protein n=1 Tax=Prosthecobacter sp. TaxID=1965333 RepID=UPI0037832AE6
MNATTSVVRIVLSMALVVLPSTHAKDKDDVHMTYPSKVEGSKGKEREKLFSPWMPFAEFGAHTAAMQRKGEQIIYFENEGGKSRGIYSSKVKLKGPCSQFTFANEKDMDAQLNSVVKTGLQPAFIVCSASGTYTMLMVSPEDLDAVRAELKALGIGQPKLR